MGITIRGLPEAVRLFESMDRNIRGVRGRVGNNISYGPLVGSHQFQRPVHRRTGWPRDLDVLNQRTPLIEQKFESALNAAVESGNVSRNPLVPPMHESVLVVQSDMSRYPPQPARSTYRRTGSYGRKWTTEVFET